MAKRYDSTTKFSPQRKILYESLCVCHYILNYGNVRITYNLTYLQVLAHFIDCIFDSSEKDKVTTLLKAVLLNVWPHLHNHR